MFEIMPLLLAAADEGAAAAGANFNIGGSITLALAGALAALAIGLIGAKGVEAIGRNPGAFGKVLTFGIIAMALAEAIAIYALLMALQKY